MWAFSTFLPMIIGDMVPPENVNWECFLTLLQITKYCTAPLVTEAMSMTLKALIDHHHWQFCQCYSSGRITPKFHYMCHFPTQLLK